MRLITQGATPNLLSEVKAHIGIVSDLDDDRLELLIDAAVDWLEEESGKCFRQNTFEIDLPCFPRSIMLPRAPLNEVVSVKYYDEDNEQQTLSTDSYYVIKSSWEESDVYIVDPPTTRLREAAVTIRWTTAEVTSAKFKQCVLVIVAHLNKNREGQPGDIQGLDRLVSHLRGGRVH